MFIALITILLFGVLLALNKSALGITSMVIFFGLEIFSLRFLRMVDLFLGFGGGDGSLPRIKVSYMWIWLMSFDMSSGRTDLCLALKGVTVFDLDSFIRSSASDIVFKVF